VVAQRPAQSCARCWVEGAGRGTTNGRHGTKELLELCYACAPVLKALFLGEKTAVRPITENLIVNITYYQNFYRAVPERFTSGFGHDSFYHNWMLTGHSRPYTRPAQHNDTVKMKERRLRASNCAPALCVHSSCVRRQKKSAPAHCPHCPRQSRFPKSTDYTTDIREGAVGLQLPI